MEDPIGKYDILVPKKDLSQNYYTPNNYIPNKFFETQIPIDKYRPEPRETNEAQPSDQRPAIGWK